MSEHYNDNGDRSKQYGFRILKSGITFGSALAMVISFTTYRSVWLAILHGILGWLFVIYYLIFK